MRACASLAVHEFGKTSSRTSWDSVKRGQQAVVKLDKMQSVNLFRFLTESCKTCKAWKIVSAGVIFLYREIGHYARRNCDACELGQQRSAVDDEELEDNKATHNDKEKKSHRFGYALSGI